MSTLVFSAAAYYTADDPDVTIEQFMRKIAEIWTSPHEYKEIGGHAFVIRRQQYTSDYAWYFTLTTSSSIELSNVVNATDKLLDLKGTTLSVQIGIMNITDGSQFLGNAGHYCGWKKTSTISRSSYSFVSNLFNFNMTLQFQKTNNVTFSACYPYAVSQSDAPFVLQPNILEIEDSEALDMKFIKLPQYSDSNMVAISRELGGNAYTETQMNPISWGSGATTDSTLQAVQVFDGKALFKNVFFYNTSAYTTLNARRTMSAQSSTNIGVAANAIAIDGASYSVVMYGQGGNNCGMLVKEG